MDTDIQAVWDRGPPPHRESAPRANGVTDDHIDSQLLGVGHLFGCLDSTIQRDDQANPFAQSIFDRLTRHAIPFGITIRDVEHQLSVSQLAKKQIDQCDCCRTVHIIVSIDHDGLSTGECQIDPFDRLAQILHQERIMQVFELRIEEPIRFLLCVYATLNKQVGKDRRNIQRGGQPSHRSRVSLLLENPSFFC